MYVLKSLVDSGYWEPIKKYIFVFKTHRGSYPDLIEKKKEMEEAYPKIIFGIKDIDDLLRIFMKLSDENIILVSNTYIIEPDFNYVSYKVMGGIIKHLSSVGGSSNIDTTKSPPDFNKKIKFNNICEFYGMNLNIASYNLPKLEDYLSSYADPDIGDYLCSILKKLYDDAKSKYPNNSNLQFKYILDNCHGPSVPENLVQSYETNSYIIISKYFEACDIFKEPPKDE